MDWFLYGIGFRHERVNQRLFPLKSLETTDFLIISERIKS